MRGKKVTVNEANIGAHISKFDLFTNCKFKLFQIVVSSYYDETNEKQHRNDRNFYGLCFQSDWNDSSMSLFREQ